MSEVAIRMTGLGKRYRLGKRQAYRALRDVIGDALQAPARLISGNGHSHAADDAGFLWALNGVSLDVRAGEVLHIPSMVFHKAEALEDTLDVDVFSPPREDWLNRTDDYLRR